MSDGSDAEFAFFLMGEMARKMWPAEHLLRDNRWGYWHPYLPFLGDEVTGKTIAIIGTGRIGMAMIKKCSGFDMNMLCFDPAYENHEYIKESRRSTICATNAACAERKPGFAIPRCKSR